MKILERAFDAFCKPAFNCDFKLVKYRLKKIYQISEKRELTAPEKISYYTLKVYYFNHKNLYNQAFDSDYPLMDKKTRRILRKEKNAGIEGLRLMREANL